MRARIAVAAAALAGVLLGACLLVAQFAVTGALSPWYVAGDLMLDALAVLCVLRLAENPYVGLRLRRDAAALGRLYRR